MISFFVFQTLPALSTEQAEKDFVMEAIIIRYHDYMLYEKQLHDYKPLCRHRKRVCNQCIITGYPLSEQRSKLYFIHKYAYPSPVFIDSNEHYSSWHFKF